VSLDTVQNSEDRISLLLKVDAYFSEYPALTVAGSAEKKLRNGMTLVMPQLEPGQYRVYGESGEFIALCAANDGKLTTVKSFFEV
jgi:tRNA pseudouridine55 synthase